MSERSDSSANDLVKNSSLYREFQSEREEILKHKWSESEKAGYDIGFERALTDWMVEHRSKWIERRASRTAAPAKEAFLQVQVAPGIESNDLLSLISALKHLHNSLARADDVEFAVVSMEGTPVDD